MDTASLEKADVLRLKRHLDQIAVPRDVFRNRESLSAVQNYIESQFKSFGYETRRQPFYLQGQELENILAQKNPGPGPRIVLGAHFDSVPETPGADDNASGIAVLLETARLLASRKAVQHVDFAAFNAEEYGMAGSQAMAADYKKFGTSLLGMISLEMVGYVDLRPGAQKIPWMLRPFYPDRGDFLALVGNWKSFHLLKIAKRAFLEANETDPLPLQTLALPGKGWMIPACRLSDHSPFWDQGYPALLVTDTSFFRNPHYHKSTDTPETLNLEFMAKTAQGVARLAERLVEP